MRPLIRMSVVSLVALFGLCDFFLPTFVASDAGRSGLNIDRITPAGDDVAPGRQIVFEFNRA
ncbi:MAG: hypothetical protein PVH42_15025, partial [Desulfobacterales bacterium]